MTIMLAEERPPETKKQRFVGLDYDMLDQDQILALLLRRRPDAPFASLVTPNADHLVRIERSPTIAQAYREADFCLNDSRISAMLARLQGLRLTTVPGADLVAALFHAPRFDPEWPLLLVGGSAEIASALTERFGLKHLTHYDAPMGLLAEPAKMAAAVQFVEDHPARFIFLAVGSPQQELIAQGVARRGRATGVGLCIGAAMEFLVHPERRAPRWMSRVGLEWLFRLCREPRRLWRRYLIDSPKLFGLVARDWLANRRRTNSSGRHQS